MKLWKKGLAALTAGLLCLGSVGLSGVELPASADVPYFYDGTYGDLYYDVIDAVEIRITGCEKEVTAVEIPAKIAGKPVTSVGRSAFSGCNSLAAVTIPDSVTRIGLDAFYKCSSLTTITMPDGVTILGADAFSFCTSLTEVTMPNSLTSIGSNAFSGCSSLTEIEIPDSVTSIRESAFSDCKKLTSIDPLPRCDSRSCVSVRWDAAFHSSLCDRSPGTGYRCRSLPLSAYGILLLWWRRCSH